MLGTDYDVCNIYDSTFLFFNYGKTTEVESDFISRAQTSMPKQTASITPYSLVRDNFIHQTLGGSARREAEK